MELCSKTKCWSLYNKMRIFQESDYSYRSKQQHSKLAKLLYFAGTHVEQWQTIFKEQQIIIEDISPETALSILKVLPLTQKKTYRVGFPDKVTAKTNKYDWQYLSSAGTNEKMSVVTDFSKRDYLRAAEYLNLFYATGHPIGQKGIDIPPSACNVVCGLADAEPEPILYFLYWKIKNRSLFGPDTISSFRGRVERQIIMKRNTVLPINTAAWSDMQVQLDDYLDNIIIKNIKVLRGLPQFLFWLARRAQERHLVFTHLKVIIPYGGLACEELIKVIKEAFSVSFCDVYGTGEVGAIGCAITNDSSTDVFQNLVYLEVLDENNAPVAEGSVGKIVVTDLNNFAMPIIRYEIGDIGKVISCEGNNNQPKVIKVLGRSQEVYCNEQGELISVRQLHNIFYQDENILNFKVEQVTKTNFKVTIVCRGLVDKESIGKSLTRLFGQECLFKIKEVAFILPETSGKYLAFKKKKDTLYA